MAEIKSEETSEKKSLNFIEQIVENDLKEGKNGGKVQTRFPPEPNGYLHIGHAKAICLDFGIAAAHGGVCNLRFDDTNPTKEDVEYVEAIKEDIQWLGYKWGNEYYASDYFQQLWDFAIRLIKEGKAYIDEQTSEQIAAQKGTPTQPGVESPYRNRPIEETLDLFQKMNSGEIEEGAMVLRAKIDMASPNMHFRDPIIYRVVKHPHHRTGTTWKAYPMYDFAHGQSDFFEGVTHSLCTLEFVPHRPLYDLFVDWVKEPPRGEQFPPRKVRRDQIDHRRVFFVAAGTDDALGLVEHDIHKFPVRARQRHAVQRHGGGVLVQLGVGLAADCAVDADAALRYGLAALAAGHAGALGQVFIQPHHASCSCVMAAVLPRVTLMRSAGAHSICVPMRPPETSIVCCARQLSS